MTRWYHPLERDNTTAQPLIATEADLKGHDEWSFRIGRAIESWDSSACFRVVDPSYDGEPDDVLMTHLGSFPIYSTRLREALEAERITGIQYLPIRVFRFSGALIQGCAIANILHAISALDIEQSEYTVFPGDYFLLHRRGQVRDLKRSVLRRSVIEPHDIIRIKEFPLYICVSERFKAIFESGGFTGYSFSELMVS